MKVVINNCFGGFGISSFAYKELLRRKGKECYFYRLDFGKGYYRIDDDPDKHIGIVAVSTKDYGNFTEKIDKEYCINYDRDDGDIRTDPDFISIIEEFGSDKCSSRFAELVIEDIPAGTYYRIDEYDGLEHIEYRDEIDWLIAE